MRTVLLHLELIVDILFVVGTAEVDQADHIQWKAALPLIWLAMQKVFCLRRNEFTNNRISSLKWGYSIVSSFQSYSILSISSDGAICLLKLSVASIGSSSAELQRAILPTSWPFGRKKQYPQCKIWRFINNYLDGFFILAFNEIDIAWELYNNPCQFLIRTIDRHLCFFWKAVLISPA